MKSLSDDLSGQEQSANKTISIKITSILYAYYLMVLLPTAYFASTYLLSHYTYGDQAYYTQFYESLKGERILEVPLQQLATTGSAEPLFGFAIWVSVNLGLGKVVFISWVNTFFVLTTGLALRKLGAGIFITTLIVTNYYFLVLLTSAERLKFSYIILALIFLSSRKLNIAFFLAAPLFHFQTVIIYASWFSNRFFQTRLSNFKKGSYQLKVALYILVAAFAGNYLLTRYGSSLTAKFLHYYSYSSFSFAQFSKALLLIFSGFLMRIRFTTLFSYFLPIFVAIALLGPERVNMIGFTMFFYLVAQQKKLKHPVFVAILLYFSFKSIGYIDNILTFGTGYPI